MKLPCLNGTCIAPTTCKAITHCGEYFYPAKLRQFPVNLCDAIVYAVAYKTLHATGSMSRAEFLADYRLRKFGVALGRVYLVPKLIDSIESIGAIRSRVKERVRCVSNMLRVIDRVRVHPGLPANLVIELNKTATEAREAGIE
jgi:hypothetical protein